MKLPTLATIETLAAGRVPAPAEGRCALSLRSLALLLVGWLVLTPAAAVAQVDVDSILAQCRTEIADYIAKTPNVKAGTRPDDPDFRDYVKSVTSKSRQQLIEARAGGEKQLADWKANHRGDPDYESVLGEAAMFFCVSGAAIAANDGGATPSPPPLASSQPAPRSVTKAPDPAPAARLAEALDEELDRFEAGAREYVQETEGTDAKECVGIVWGGYNDGAKLMNTCTIPIEVFWCVDGLDCNPTFSSQNTLHPGTNSYSYAFGTSKEGYGRLVRYGACVAGDDVSYRELPSFQYQCKARRK